jgi:hypothetical protein
MDEGRPSQLDGSFLSSQFVDLGESPLVLLGRESSAKKRTSKFLPRALSGVKSPCKSASFAAVKAALFSGNSKRQRTEMGHLAHSLDNNRKIFGAYRIQA